MNFDERAVARELHDAGVGLPAMAVPDEDIAIRRDQDGRRHVERVGAIASHPGLAKCHQELTVRAELEHLVTLSFFGSSHESVHRMG